MGWLLEFIFEYLLGFPGAFFRWLFFGMKKPFGYYLGASPEINTLVAIVVFAGVIMIFRSILS
jgi:hypothetical protein